MVRGLVIINPLIGFRTSETDNRDKPFSPITNQFTSTIKGSTFMNRGRPLKFIEGTDIKFR